MKTNSLFHSQIIRFIEIALLALFISSHFMPYVYGVRPREFYWDIWSSGRFDWQIFIVIGVPLLLSYWLLIFKIAWHKTRNSKFKFLIWSFEIIFAFILILFLINIATTGFSPSYKNLFVTPVILSVILSLGLFIPTILLIKESHIKIENIIISIITIPAITYSIAFLFEFDFGGYILNVCFIILYVTALLKISMANKAGEQVK